MNCPSCAKETAPDSYFCNWCDAYIPAPNRGRKANTFLRFIALLLDPLIGLVLYFVPVAILASVSEDPAVLVAVLLPVVYLVWFLMLLRQGLTPGKRLMGLVVVEQRTGRTPGFGRMFVRELPGRFLSGLLFGLGYLWALFDRNGQAWHDKLAGTVVLRRAG